MWASTLWKGRWFLWQASEESHLKHSLGSLLPKTTCPGNIPLPTVQIRNAGVALTMMWGLQKMSRQKADAAVGPQWLYPVPFRCYTLSWY